MSGPVEFLCAKLDEIEARAKAAEAVGYFIDSVYSMGDRYLLDPDIEINKRFVEDWDPATVLRMVASTRQVLELHFHPFDTNTYCVLCGWGEGDGNPEDGYWPCGTVKALAKGWGWTDE